MIYLEKQLEKYPSMEAQDIIKLCYQAAFGGEHILRDINGAREYFMREFADTEPDAGELWEPISHEACRINIAPWKEAGLGWEWLWSIFERSAQVCEGGEKRFGEYLGYATKLCPWCADAFEQYLARGVRPVHHSSSYREKEQPHYRVASRRLARLIPLLQEIHEKNARIIAIEGKAASGKTTMASELSHILGASVIHMDDFFLPPHLRSEARLCEAGGNIHYERFACEVLPNLRENKAFRYTAFDCSRMEMGEKRTIEASPYIIVEGAYSLHPYFGDYADVKAFSDVSPEEQMERILRRNGSEMAEVFRTRWIPMEEKYYAELNVKLKADLIL